MGQEKEEKKQVHIHVPLMIYAFWFLIDILWTLVPLEVSLKWSPVIRFPWELIFKTFVPLALTFWYVKKGEKRAFWASVGIERERSFDSFIWIFALFLPFILVLGPSYLLAETLVVTQAPPPEFWSPPEWWYLYKI